MKKTTPKQATPRLVLTHETLRHITGGYGDPMGCMKSNSGSDTTSGSGGGGGGTMK